MTKLDYLASAKLNDSSLSKKRELTLTDMRSSFVLGCNEIIQLVEERVQSGHDLDQILWELQLIQDKNENGSN